MREKLIEVKYRHINRSKFDPTREALRKLADDMIKVINPPETKELDLTLAAIASRGRGRE